jgi:hypothetical protein
MSHHASGPNFGFPRGDARLDITDLYVFANPRDAGKSILVLNVHPSVAVNPLRPTSKSIRMVMPLQTSPTAFSSHLPKTASRSRRFAVFRVRELLGCATTARLSSKEHRCQSIGRRW